MQVHRVCHFFWHVDLTFGKAHEASSQGIYYYGVVYHQGSPDERGHHIIASPTGERDEDETQTSSSYGSEYSILHIP